jgi:hypothetical protein
MGSSGHSCSALGASLCDCAVFKMFSEARETLPLEGFPYQAALVFKDCRF